MYIGSKCIGPDEKPVIVAEISASHGGDFSRAIRLIELAKHCGADAVKFQCYTPESITINSKNNDFKIKDGPWRGRYLYELYTKAQTPREWFPALFRVARELGLVPFASVFSEEDVDFISAFEPSVYKISSFEIRDKRLITYASRMKSALIISTGMADSQDIEDAYTWCNGPCCLLHCVSEYPARISEMQMGHLKYLSGIYTNVGLSDHTVGNEAAIIATAMGANLIEKHLTLSRFSGAEDDKFASEPQEFMKMVQSIEETWDACRTYSGGDNTHKDLKRSLYVVKDIKEGEVFSHENIRSIRPGYGLDPANLDLYVIGRVSLCDIEVGSPLKREMIKDFKKSATFRIRDIK